MCFEIEKLRRKIDSIDDQVRTLLEQRMAIIMDIAIIKEQDNLPILDSDREHEIISRITMGQNNGMAEFTESVFTAVLAASRSYQARKSDSEQ